MDKKYREAFSAVIDFVDDLNAQFEPRKSSPLDLYTRIVEKITFKDAEAVNKVLTGFREFLISNEENILNNRITALPRNERILYGDSGRIYIDIQRFVANSDNECKDAIRGHLLNILAILEDDVKAVNALKSLQSSFEPTPQGIPSIDPKEMLGNFDTSTNEGKFVQDTLSKVDEAMKGVDANNPMEVIGQLMSGDLMGSIMGGMQNGDMDVNKLVAGMGQMFTGLAENMNKEAIESTDDVDDEHQPDITSADGIADLVEKMEKGKSEDTKSELGKGAEE